MLRPNDDKVQAKTLPNFSDDAVHIKAGAVVIKNVWVNYDSTIFRINSYITRAVAAPRTRFFKDRGYAVYLLIGLDLNEGIKVIEGVHVLFSSIGAVPPPTQFTIAPLIGIVLIQDGTNDLNFGYRPLRAENLRIYSGTGNILDWNLKGDQGPAGQIIGYTGPQGLTGLEGLEGPLGVTGLIGETGVKPVCQAGETGPQGMTGLNWDIDIPFEIFT